MSKLAGKLELLQDGLKAAKLLQSSGAIDLRKPKTFIESSKAVKAVGPIGALVMHNGKDVPNLSAITDEKGTLTWAELDRQSNALANALFDAGVAPGQVVGIIARDHRALPLALSACGRAGIRLAMMNTGFSAPQFAEVAAREGVRAVLYDEEFADAIADVPADIPRILTWIDGDRPVPDDVRTLDDVVQNASAAIPDRPEKYAGMVILTSGTTGLPKGATRSQFSPFSSALLLDRIKFPRNGSVVIVSPLFHATGFAMYGISTSLQNKAVLMRRFDPEKTLAAIADNHAEALIAVPTMLHRMVALGPEIIGKYDLSSLKTVVVAGSALSPKLCIDVQEAFGDVLYNLYGSTEVAVASVANPQELRLAPGTVGRPPVSSYLALYDDNDQRIDGVDVKGRLFVRNGAPFEGYTDGRNKQVIDGYMSTGDMGYFDKHGLLHIAGRDDDMIVSGGENVYPLEVENLLAEHEDVADIAVIGVPDDEFGTRLRAFIIPQEGREVDVDAIKAYVKSNLARYKVPRDVVVVEELPRNPTGKLVRRLLPTGPLD